MIVLNPNCLKLSHFRCVWFAFAFLGVIGLINAAESGLPSVELVGVIDAGNGKGHAIIENGGTERLVAIEDYIDERWQLAEVHKDYVLLTDTLHVIRLDMYSSSPYSLGLRNNEVEPLEIHTARTHPELEPGQSRKFYTPADEALAGTDGEFEDPMQYVNEINDPGMTRTFLGPPPDETFELEEKLPRPEPGVLEPGQSIIFLGPPPDEPEDFE